MTEAQRVRFNTELIRHIAGNRNDAAKLMLKQDLINAFDGFGTLLHYTAVFGNTTIAQYLINNGSTVDALGKDDRTPLAIAIEYEQGKAAEVLLKAGASIDIASANGKSPLQMVFLVKHKEYVPNNTIHLNFKIMQALVRKARTDASNNEEFVEKLFSAGCTLHHVVYLREPVILKGLILHGRDVNFRNTDEFNGSTALHLAVKINDFEMAKILIENGADVNAPDNDGDTPLAFAARQRALATLQLLLQSGAYPHQRSLFKIFRGSHHEQELLDACAVILLQYGAFPKDMNKVTLLIEYAMDLRRSRVTDHLIAHAAMLEGSASSALIELCRTIFDRSTTVQLENYSELCQQMLKKIVFLSLSLFDLIAGSDRQMRRCVRNVTFVSHVEQFCAVECLSSVCPYYYIVLRRRISGATRQVKLEDQAMPVICDIFQRNENECYVAAKKIFGCLSECDLKQLVKCDED